MQVSEYWLFNRRDCCVTDQSVFDSCECDRFVSSAAGKIRKIISNGMVSCPVFIVQVLKCRIKEIISFLGFGFWSLGAFCQRASLVPLKFVVTK